MIRRITYRTAALLIVFFVSTAMIGMNSTKTAYISDKQLLYDNIWGAIYNPETSQCDGTPTITGDGSHINYKKASKHRWIAISQDMLNDINRLNLMKYPTRTSLYKGKIEYGDTIWIESPNSRINGWWVARDAKRATYTKSIDFLQTTGDGSLYDNNILWSGRFEDIKIYRLKNTSYKERQKLLHV